MTLEPTPDEFRELGYRVIDTLADHYEQIEDDPPLTDDTPAEVAGLFA